MTSVLSIPTSPRKFSIASAPVQVAQIGWELETLIALYRARAPKRVLEIGTFCGGTLFHFIQNATPGTRIVTVDSLIDAPDNRHLYNEWHDGSIGVFPIIGDSHDADTVAQVAEHAPFDLIFIDGLHTYEAVKKDWDLYRPLAAPGAVIGLHDIRLVRDYPDTGQTAGVSVLWRELQESGLVTQEIVCQPGQQEYGIGAIYL